ncbi:SDR family NAD(P)-dependent oxidoreductase [Streptomyces sp. CAU 1734]|uniref:SDR family NAD(P)-dependent oxidoreductase n=1 Tax=Streptomyces sp. CAU 1734 TaxID=3140360 RepID=UPI0032619A7F
MMRTYVITGGTDGMGKGLAGRLLARGDRVFAVASGEARGRALLDEAARTGAGDRAVFLRADLSTLAGVRSVLAEVRAATDTVDGLILGAQRFRPRREETADGFEFTFALAYLSRYLLGHGLAEPLERAAAPVILNLAAPGGPGGRIHWDDLQLRDGYGGMRAALQSSRCNDLLAVSFPERHPGARTRYVVHNPGFVRTGQPDQLPQPSRALARTAALLFAQPVGKAIEPLLRRLDEPPADPVAAVSRDRRLPLTTPAFAPAAARRLDTATARLLGE